MNRWGKAHLADKPQHHTYGRPAPPGGPGDGGSGTGAEAEEVDVGEGSWGLGHPTPPPPPKKRGSPRGDRARRGEASSIGGGEKDRGYRRINLMGGNMGGDPRGGGLPPPEENIYLPGFTPERALLLLQEVYGDFPHPNNGLHLDGGVADDGLW